MKSVPFYENHEDNMRCMLAVYSMIRGYFEGYERDWDDMIEFSGYEPGVAAWSLASIMKFIDLGYEVRMIEPFDYATFAEKGEKYLHELYRPEEVEWQLKNSNIMSMKQDIPRFLESVQYEMRTPTLQDIDEMLDAGMLVNVMLDSGVLNSKDTYSAHSILVTDVNGENYIAHDPGLPGVEDREIEPALLLKAMGGEKNSAEVTGYKLARN